MASPFALPDAVPPPLASGHSFSVAPLGRPRDRDQGERRMRPRFRFVPLEVDVSWALTQAEFDALDVFFNDTIRAGESSFDARVHLRGSDFAREWFTCQWIGDYEWSVGTASAEGLEYRVSTRLRLLESLGETREAPGILASGADVDTGGARLAAGILRASGTDVDDGTADFEGIQTFAGGADTDDGGWNTGLVVSQDRVTEAADLRELEESTDTRVTE
jgi:hypothetical protein